MKRSNSIADKVYKYVHHQDVWLVTNLTDVVFENDLLKIENDGKITLKGSYKDGYAWDGCSPKRHFLHFIVGIPDGKLDYRTEKPITYFASMVHDIIYQFKSELDISRKETDVIFRMNLKEAGFLWTGVYYLAVRMFGGLYGKWKKKKPTVKVKISERSWRSNENT